LLLLQNSLRDRAVSLDGRP